METLIKDLKKLKEKVKLLIDKKISTQKFDKWIVTQVARNDMDDFYDDLVSGIMVELDVLQTEFLDSIKWRRTDKDRIDYKKITYSKEYLNKILNKIDRKIKEIKKLIQLRENAK